MRGFMPLGGSSSIFASSPFKVSPLLVRTILLTFLLLTLFAFAVVVRNSDSMPYTPKSTNSNSNNPGPDYTPLIVAHGAVASDNENCSLIGTSVLRDLGGNAVDAAVTTALCLGVLQPFASGIGGGGYMIVRMVGSDSKVIDFRDVAPLASTPDMYTTPDAKGNTASSTEGGLSIAIPGELAGLWHAHQKWGTLPWAKVVDPALRLARDGFVCGKLMALRLTQIQAAIFRHPELQAQFAPNGRLYVEGEIITRPKLAATLAKIAQYGAPIVYDPNVTGSIVADIVADMQEADGIATANDFAAYRALEKEPLRSWYRGLEVLGVPPSSSGGMAIAMTLNVLERYHVDDLYSARKPGLAAHVLTESFKHAFSHRMLLGDPAFVNISDVIDVSQSKPYASQLRSLGVSTLRTYDSEFYTALRDNLLNSMLSPLAGEIMNRFGTSHFSIVDAKRNAVAMTTSVNHSFGSKIIGTRTGIVFNNQMDDFSTRNASNAFGLRPSLANWVGPGRRPLSSMSPTMMLRDGYPALVIGASGGPTIITALVQVLVNVVDQEMNAKQAVEMPRFHHQLYPNNVTIEVGFDPAVREFLESRGHMVSDKGTMLADGHLFGNVQCIVVRDDNMIEAASDSRKMSKAAGY